MEKGLMGPRKEAKLNKVEAIIRPEKLEAVKEALAERGFVELNVVNVVGRGVQKGVVYLGRAGEKTTVDMLPKVKLELVVREADTEKVLNIILAAARTGNIGDGKIFVIPVSEVIRVRTGERGEQAI
jgi:nitrogen regulatory protein P-II 1